MGVLCKELPRHTLQTHQYEAARCLSTFAHRTTDWVLPHFLLNLHEHETKDNAHTNFKCEMSKTYNNHTKQTKQTSTYIFCTLKNIGKHIAIKAMKHIQFQHQEATNRPTKMAEAAAVRCHPAVQFSLRGSETFNQWRCRRSRKLLQQWTCFQSTCIAPKLAASAGALQMHMVIGSSVTTQWQSLCVCRSQFNQVSQESQSWMCTTAS